MNEKIVTTNSWLLAVMSTSLLLGCRAADSSGRGAGTDQDASRMGEAGAGGGGAGSGGGLGGGGGNGGSSGGVLPPADARDSRNVPEGGSALDRPGFLEDVAPDHTPMAVEAGDPGPARIINGQRWEVLCTNPIPPTGGNETCVNVPPTGCPGGGTYNLNKTVTFGGAPGTTYDVAVRIRGLVEPKPYVGGKSDGKHFYTGGTPVTEGDAGHYNVYSMSVSSPRQVYYFNFDEGKGVSHYVFPIDHMKTLPIEGGATIKMVAFDSNCLAIGNCMKAGPGCTSMPYIIPGVPPYPKAWNGQFVQLDVISVTP